MNIKTMEGIVGAKTNMDLVNTPMRVYKDARRRGDLSVMERAMGYVGDYSGKAEEYQAEAKEGMKEDAKEARETEEALREKLIEKRREERETLEDGRKEDREVQTDTVELSEEGKALLKNHGNLDSEVFQKPLLIDNQQ